MRLVRIVFAVSLVLACSLPGTSRAQPLPRPNPHAGTIVASRGGEQLQPVGIDAWRSAEVRQDLLGGDTLRTNASGHLAILFADQTQIRVGRNSVLLVKDVADSGPALFGLPIGTLWARAARGGRDLSIETPSATAAIRGTDWSLAVARDGTTMLIVLEGTVELRNPLGAVTVGRGEAATAAIGKRPTKIILVSPKDREQMLFYLSLRDAFTWLPTSPLSGPRQRAEHNRLEATPPAARTAEDWLALAEVSLRLEGRTFAADALRRAEAFPLNPMQQARADLVAGMLAGAAQQWQEAQRRFSAALPHLTGRSRVSARYGYYFASALAEPSHAPNLPLASEQDDAYGALAQAWIAGFLEDPATALALLRQAEARYPDEAILPAARAQVAEALDQRAEMKAAADRAVALDPENPLAIEAVARYKADIGGDMNGARADLIRALGVAPGETALWNDLALVQNERDAPREAEAAFQNAIATDPEDPVPRGNYAIFLLDQSRVAEAKRQIDAALVLDRTDPSAYLALGRYYVQIGDTAQGIHVLLEASAANPAHSNTLLGLAVAYYQRGEDQPAIQQLDNAERLDPNDPIIPLARTAFALDRYEADTAIASAREAVRRFQARGGYYATLAENRQSGSYLSQAFRFLGLEDWGRFYGDAVFDPFSASGYFDQAIAARPDPFFDRIVLNQSTAAPNPSPVGFAALLQGLVLEPLAVASPLRRTQIVRQPFVDGEVGGGTIVRDGKPGWSADATAQFFSNAPFPVALSATGSGLDSNGDRRNDRNRSQNGTVLLGADPRPYDHLVLVANVNREEPLLPGPSFFPTPADRRSTKTVLGAAGWGHEFGERSVLTAMAAYIHGRDTSFRSLLEGLLTRRTVANEDTGLLNVGHLYGIGPVALHYGLEASRTGTENTQEVRIIVPTPVRVRNNPSITGARPYVDATLTATDTVSLEAGAYGAILHGAGYDVNRVEPRIGLAYAPAQKHWLRVGYRQETMFASGLTLSPVAILGLVPQQTPVATGGRVDTALARWDAEWTPRLFTALEYQHQFLRGIAIPIPATIDNFSVTEGRVDRLSASADFWVGWGVGLFGTASYAHSHDRSNTANRGHGLPYLPRHVVQFGATWAHPSRVKISVAESLVGRRQGDLAGTRLDAYRSTDVSFTWEPGERRVSVELALLNLLDEAYRVAPGIAGPGRTFVGNVHFRF